MKNVGAPTAPVPPPPKPFTREWWTASVRFSSEQMRRRLELAAAVVLTTAAVVGLSHAITPDPSKLSSANNIVSQPVSRLERFDRLDARGETRPPPKVPPAFAEAVAKGDVAQVAALYKPGMPLDEMLFIGAGSGSVDTVRFLLDHGADVHEGEETTNAPVLNADEYPAIVSLLLERGAKAPDLTGAARAGAVNMVFRLVDDHADVNPPESSPLAEAIVAKRPTLATKKRIVEKLLAAKADPNRSASPREDDGASLPLTEAVRLCSRSFEDPEPTRASDCMPIIEPLMKKGARSSGETLTAALWLDDPTRDVVLDAVLARIAPGATAIALTRIQIMVPPPIAKKVIAKGVDWAWHEGEDDAALPLVTAVEQQNRELVRLMIDAGAPVNRQFRDGKSALGAALDVVSTESGEGARVVELLLARGADVNRRLPDGRTPLFAAAEAGDVRVIHALLDRGARPNDIILDDTALDAAEQHGHTPAARVLHARGGRPAPRRFGQP